jgi:hypothetical protein
MLDPDTKRLHLSCDIVWTGRMYFDSMQKYVKGLLYIQFLKIRTTMKSTMKRKKEIMKIMMILSGKINKVRTDNESNNQIKTQSG